MSNILASGPVFRAILLLLAVFSAGAFGAEVEGSVYGGGNPLTANVIGSGNSPQNTNPLSGLITLPGTVSDRYANGVACVSDSYCASGLCLHGTCRASFPYCPDSYCDTGESCNSCSQDCGGCPGTSQSSSQQSLMGAVGSIEGIESDLLRFLNASNLAVLNKQAEALALAGKLGDVERRLNQVYAVVSQVFSSLRTDAYLLDNVLLSDSVDELGLGADSIRTGREALAQAGALLAQAANQTNPVQKAFLLKEAIGQELRAVELLPEVSKSYETFDSPPVSSSEISAALKLASSPEAREAISSIKPNSDIALERTLEVYTLTNLEKSKKEAFRSRIVLSIRTAANLSNILLIEVLPKSLAKSSGELAFSVQPVILQSDPVVSWSWESLPARSATNVSYVLKSKLSSLSSHTLASGTTVSPRSRPLSPPILCGDGNCEEGENLVNCPQDCKLLCAKRTTPAVSPSGECREFISPCDVPEGWSRVLSCALPLKSREVGKGTLLLFLVAFFAIVSLIMVSIRSYESAGVRLRMGKLAEEERRMLDVERQFKLRLMKYPHERFAEEPSKQPQALPLTPQQEKVLTLRKSLELSSHRLERGGTGIDSVLGRLEGGKEQASKPEEAQLPSDPHARMRELDRKIREEIERLGK